MQRWEYSVIQANQKVVLFQDGIKVEPIHKDKGDDSDAVAIFKRPVELGRAVDEPPLLI